MGIKERHERDREAVSRAILDAARDLFVLEGYQHVSIRKIAERIEYSPAAIYGYFPSKDDIFFALAEEGFRLLHGDAAGNAFDQVAPLDRIRAIFWRLYQFSREQPEYFALMFVDRSVPRIGREYERFAFAREHKARALAMVQECIDQGALPANLEPPVVLRLLMTGIVGIASLRLSERLGPDENADDLARDLLELTIAGLQTGATLRSHLTSCSFDEPESSTTDRPPSSQESVS